jgi:hypothetical protein
VKVVETVPPLMLWIVYAVLCPLLILTLFATTSRTIGSRPKYLGPREWSLGAEMDFREFNELQHNFERRMGPSYEAEGYLSLFGKTRLSRLPRILCSIVARWEQFSWSLP